MRASYIPEGAADSPLLLFAEVSASDATTLTEALQPLASGARLSVLLHLLPAWDASSGIRVEALRADRDAGCSIIDQSSLHFRCALRATTWEEVIGLLAPFAEPSSDHSHQYLNGDGPVTWFASTDTSF